MKLGTRLESFRKDELDLREHIEGVLRLRYEGVGEKMLRISSRHILGFVGVEVF